MMPRIRRKSPSDNTKKGSQRRRRSIPYGIDFDLDDSDDEHISKNKNISKKRSYQSMKSLSDQYSDDNHENEFETDGDIFESRSSKTVTDSMIEDIAKLSDDIHSVALRDAYGRQLRRRDSLDSSYVQDDSSSSLTNSLNCSPLSTMSKIHFSSSSSASSRKSSNSDAPNLQHNRSLSPAPARHRQYSANSYVSTTGSGAKSPGMPRKVSNSANMLTAGLAMESSRHKKGSRSSSRDHSPSRR